MQDVYWDVTHAAIVFRMGLGLTGGMLCAVPNVVCRASGLVWWELCIHTCYSLAKVVVVVDDAVGAGAMSLIGMATPATAFGDVSGGVIIFIVKNDSD